MSVESGSLFQNFANDSIVEMILCNIKIKLRGLKLKTITSGGNNRGFDMCIHSSAINETMKYTVNHDKMVVYSTEFFSLVNVLTLSVAFMGPRLSLGLAVCMYRDGIWIAAAKCRVNNNNGCIY